MWGSGAARSQWRPVKKQEEEGEGEESHEFTLDVPGRERNNKHSRGEGSGEGEGRTFLDGADMAQKQGVKQNITHIAEMSTRSVCGWRKQSKAFPAAKRNKVMKASRPS